MVNLKTLVSNVGKMKKYYDLDTVERGSCRCCKHFMRVQSDSMRGIHVCRGFCLLGKLEGDYSLYCSSSYAEECPSYVADDYNIETFKVEHQLRSEQFDFDFKIDDRRTKVHKLVKEKYFNNEELEKCFNASVGHRWVARLMNRDINKSLYEVFFELHLDTYKWLWNRDEKKITQKYYWAFLHSLSKQFNDYFSNENELEEINEHD